MIAQITAIGQTQIGKILPKMKIKDSSAAEVKQMATGQPLISNAITSLRKK